MIHGIWQASIPGVAKLRLFEPLIAAKRFEKLKNYMENLRTISYNDLFFIENIMILGQE